MTTSHSEGPGALSRGARTEPWLESPSADSRESAMPQCNNRSFNGPCQVRSGLAHASRPRVDQKGKAQAQGEEQAQNRTESKSGKSKPRPAVHISAPRPNPATKIARAKVQEKVQWEGQARPNHPEEEPARRNLVASTTKGCMRLERQPFEHSIQSRPSYYE